MDDSIFKNSRELEYGNSPSNSELASRRVNPAIDFLKVLQRSRLDYYHQMKLKHFGRLDVN